MTGPSIDPATLSTISAKIDYALMQLSIINEQLDSHEERLARLEKFEQARKVGSLLRRATLASGYIIDGAPSAASPSSTTLQAVVAVPALFHTAAQFAAPAAADIDGGALFVGWTASTLLVAAPTVISALAVGAATAPLAAKAEIAAVASALATSSSCSSAAVQRYVPPHQRAKAKAEASATVSALAVPSSSSSVHLFSATDGRQGLGAILALDVHARGGSDGYLMSCPEEQVRGVGLWWAALCMLDMPYGPVDWFLPTAPAHRMPAVGRCLLYGLLHCCCCFVTPSAHVQSIAELLLPWDPGKPWIFVLRMERGRMR